MAQVQRRIVHKQFNSPIALYSDTNVKETLDRELKTLNNGAVGWVWRNFITNICASWKTFQFLFFVVENIGIYWTQVFAWGSLIKKYFTRFLALSFGNGEDVFVYSRKLNKKMWRESSGSCWKWCHFGELTDINLDLLVSFEFQYFNFKKTLNLVT